MSQTSSFSLPIGPVHVALEEPVYFHLDVDGETVRKVEITSGHVHRGMEGMATQRNFFKNTTLTERVCSLCSNSHSLTYCMAVENVLGMTPPPRAQYLRVLAEETKRVASHLFNIAIFAHNVGFKSLFLHIMEVRENMQDVKETIYGNRMNLSANCIGGVKFDMDDSLTMYMLERLDTVEEAVKRVEKVFRTDPLIARRSRGVGVLSREDAWALGVVGPVARGSGLDIDVRKNTPYLVYPDLYFDIVKEQDARWCACARCSSPSACSASVSTSSPTARWPCTWSASRKANPSPARRPRAASLSITCRPTGPTPPPASSGACRPT